MKKILIVCLLILSMFTLAAQRKASEYESEFVTLEPGTFEVFEHGLGKPPRVVYVWVKEMFLGTEDIETVRPWTELLDHPLYIQDTTAQTITLFNTGDMAYTVQVYAK